MKEKVLWLDLPEGAECQEVIVTGKRRWWHCVCRRMHGLLAKRKSKVEIPKPKALVGGGEVYQNDDVPYWYCKIKNGRDTFMHVYMEDLTEEDLLYDSKTGKKREFSTRKHKRYKKNVLEALADKPKEGFRWIAVYEASPTPNGSVQFVEGEKPLVGLSGPEWDKMLKEYSPENESAKISKTTYFLLSLRWLKDGLATLEQLVDHSEEIGHYRDSENPKYDLEKTGERKFGGVCGFVGNTWIIVEAPNSESGYLILGGYYDLFGNFYPFAEVFHVNGVGTLEDYCVCWLELKK